MNELVYLNNKEVKKEMEKRYVKIPMKSIYVVENQYGFVKIGVSSNAKARIKVLSKQGGFEVSNLYSTQPCSNGYKIENRIHKFLKARRINGEWFEINFEEAIKIVLDIFNSLAKFEERKQRCLTPEDISKAFEMRA